MVARQSPKGIIQGACQEIVAKCGKRHSRKELREAAQELHDNIEALLADTRPLQRDAPSGSLPNVDAPPGTEPVELATSQLSFTNPEKPPAEAVLAASAPIGAPHGTTAAAVSLAADAAADAPEAAHDYAPELNPALAAPEGAAADADQEPASTEIVPEEQVPSGQPTSLEVVQLGPGSGEVGVEAADQGRGDPPVDDSQPTEEPLAAARSTNPYDDDDEEGDEDGPRSDAQPVGEGRMGGARCPDMTAWGSSVRGRSAQPAGPCCEGEEENEEDGNAGPLPAEDAEHEYANGQGAADHDADLTQQDAGAANDEAAAPVGAVDLQQSMMEDYLDQGGDAGESATLYVDDGAAAPSQPPLVEDYVKAAPAAGGQISERAAYMLMRVLRLCRASGVGELILIALRTLEKLIALQYITGEVSNLMLENEGGGPAGPQSGMHARGLSVAPDRLDMPSAVLHLICSCDDHMHDEEVEIAVIRAILTIVTSTTFEVHSMALLLVIRACYNMYIVSRSETNQVTAKAALTQMVNVVFQRLAAGEVVQVRPVVTSELLGVGTREGQRDWNTAQALITQVWQQVFGNDDEGAAARAPDVFTQPDTPMSSPSPARPGLKGAKSAIPAAAAAEAQRELAGARSVSASNASLTSQDPGSAATSTRSLERMQLLELDACKVFRALCKLAIRSVEINDSTVTNGRILAMELLYVILQNHGDEFVRHDRLMGIVKNDLNMCLLHNCKSTSPFLQRLSCQIFVVVLRKFRQHLKALVSYLFENTILKGLELAEHKDKEKSVPVDVEYRVVVLRCLRPVVTDGQLLIDLYVNYDCDVNGQSADIFERLFTGLRKTAMTPEMFAEPGEVMPVAQKTRLRQEGLSVIVAMLEALNTWYEVHANNRIVPAMEGAAAKPSASQNARSAEAEAAREPAGITSMGADLLDLKEKKKAMIEGIKFFNLKPKKGIKGLQEAGLVGPTPQDVAKFLKSAQGLDPVAVGDFISGPEEESRVVMHAYLDQMEFEGMEFDEAIRIFLLDFRLPGEAQKIDRLMEKFAERYHTCNSHLPNYPFANAQTAYVLAYSVIMLNTDQHNPTIKRRMTVEDFIKNNRGINDEKDIDRDWMAALYDRIKNKQIMMRHTMIEENTESAVARDTGLMTAVFGLFGRSKEIRQEPSDAQVKQLSEFLKEKAKGQQFYVTQDPDALRPLVSFSWEYILPMLSTFFNESTDSLLTNECLSGLVAASCLACNMEIRFDATAFINTLAKFTCLHEPQHMQIKNAFALRSLLSVPDRVGSSLHDNWVVVLRCLSRFEFVRQIASGSPTDISLFGAADAAKAQDVKKPWWALGRSETAKKRHSQPGALVDVGMDMSGLDTVMHAPPPAVMECIDDHVLGRIFVNSCNLSNEALVEFMQALTVVSNEELRAKHSPCVFAVNKIIDVCHHNMMRPRIVWTSIWKGIPDGWTGLSEFFVHTGCLENLQVAMYAMDALRQICMKFLERSELANYSFQNDFLKPFVVVMRQSKAPEIRELIIRCLSLMVLSRVQNIKSGWKSMFMVFSEAARDQEPSIVRLAFDTIERIVRDHFVSITETDVAVFTDCVNCLTAYTNQDHDDDVALNAIAFLRFCAIRLAEGSIGDVDTLPEDAQAELTAATSIQVTRFKNVDNGGAPAPPAASAAPPAAPADPASPLMLSPDGGASATARSQKKVFTDRDEHLFFWTPLLFGLAELTFDVRVKVRTSALDVLFNILSEHGACFTEAFWQNVYKNMLLPIFDSVQMQEEDLFDRRVDDEEAWLYETCSHCLQHLIDLTVKCYPMVRDQLPHVLAKIKAFMTRSHQHLASVGVAAMERLIASAGRQMTPEMWNEVARVLLQVMEETLPDMHKLIDFPERYTRPEFDGSLPPSPDAAARLPPAKPVYLLTDGLGLRRLQQLRARAHVQLLLVQTCSEIYAQHHAHMPGSAITFVLQAVTRVYEHARALDTDAAARQKLARWQAEDRVPEDTRVADPPMMKLEMEAGQTLLSLLLHLFTADELRESAAQADAERRLFEACLANLERFDASMQPSTSGANGQSAVDQVRQTAGEADAMQVSTTKGGRPIMMASIASEHRTLAPLIVATLNALRAFSDAQFRKYLKTLFPLMTKLIRCVSAPIEVQMALSDLFATRVGPLL